MAFAAAERDGVLTLTLDTPGSPVNILNHATARQLVEILAEVSPARTRAIVFDSAKPGSFLNGVGLLLAHASRTIDDVERASAIPWAAYRAVYESPVPTIALVQGTCFGCGVEFALSCRHRVATDSGETQFYMTELDDYLFLPLFGSTWNLPEAVGLGAAVDLLLWGERWGAREAERRGLVDAVIPFEERDAHARRFVERVLDGSQPSAKRGRVVWSAAEDAALARARARIAALPSAYRPVYEDGLDLLATGARRRGSYLEHQRRELDRSAASALAPIGKAAYAFFYLRQMAAQRAAGRDRGGADEPIALCLDIGERSSARSFGETVRARRFPGVALAPAASADFRLLAADSPDGSATGGGGPAAPDGREGHARAARSEPRGCDVAVSVELACDVAVRVELAWAPSARVEIYAPFFPAGRLVELAIAEPGAVASGDARARGAAGPARDPARLARLLQRFGFEVARTAPGEAFLTTRLLASFLAPLVRFVERGGAPGAVTTTLREAGFVRTPSELVSAFDRSALAGVVAAALPRDAGDPTAHLAALAAASGPDGRREPGLLDALAISLVEAAHAARATRCVADPSVIDLVARELLDFPRHRVSLCTWLKRSRVARATAQPEARDLVSAHALEAAIAFAAEGREFYR